MYKNYIFDLYGTLVDIHTDENLPLVWEKLSLFYSYYGANYTSGELKSSYLLEVSHEQLKDDEVVGSNHEAYPEIKLEYVFQKLFLNKGVEANLELSIHVGQMFRALSTEFVKLYEGVRELLEALKKSGKKVYLLSNAQYIFTYYELIRLGILESFDDVFISSDYGCKKPDSRFYAALIKKHDLKKEESIMIGNDYQADILGAKQLGLDTFYIHSNLSPQIEEEIKSTYLLMEMDMHKVRELLGV